MNLPFLLNPIFLWIYCGMVFVLSAFWTWQLCKKAKDLQVRLREATKKLSSIEGEQGFVEHFEQYDKYAENKFDRAWKEFVEMLVLPSPGSGKPIYNTGEVSKYLNETTIIFPKVDFRFYHSVPNLLMGLGILGTFVGLAVGVGTADTGLASGIPSEITASLEQLLSGAGLAFWSSIVGILLSLAFAAVERNRSRRLHLGLYKWVDELEKHLRLVTAPEIALKQLKQAEVATTQLTRFNTDLVFSLEKALEDKIAGRLTPHLERLVESIEGLRSDRASDAGRMIEHSLAQFTTAMQQQTGSQFGEMASVVGDLNSSLKDTSRGFAQTRQDIHTMMGSLIKNMETSLHENTRSMTKTLQQSLEGVSDIVTDASKQVADRMIASTNASSSELHATISNLTENLATASISAVNQITGSVHGLQEAAEGLRRSSQQNENVLSSMTSFVNQLNSLSSIISSSHREMATMSEQLGRAAHDVQISSNRSADSLQLTQETVNSMGILVRELEKHQESTTVVWAQYRERFEGIDDSLKGVFEQMDEGLSRYCSQVQEFTTTLDRTFADAIKNLSGAIGEFNDSIEDLIPRLPSNTA